MRIGEVADQVGVTTRTIRYYEERGLLGGAEGRQKGSHRHYTDADVARLKELLRMRDLLGLSLEEITGIVEAEESRAALRDRWPDASDDERLRIVDAAIPLVERQLELVRSRQERLSEFADELSGKLNSLKSRRQALAS